jgi:hypothetical protein
MHEIAIRCQNDLNKQGYCITKIQLPDHFLGLVLAQNWEQLDDELNHFFNGPSELSRLLGQLVDYETTEHIISIRDGSNAWEEDGIWHDDGSRLLAFSLSLTPPGENKNIKGGILEIRKKGSSISHQIAPFDWGEIVIFQTGLDAYEHKINCVKNGRRIIMAGWLS